jgi:MFS family permease
LPQVNIKLGLKQTATNILLVGNAFVWYLLIFKTLGLLTDQAALSSSALMIYGTNAISLALFAFVGSFLIGKLKDRAKFLDVWMLSGVFLSLMPLLLDLSSLSSVVSISILFGAYFGLGMPIVMGYFSANTSTENRAKVSGITFLVIGLLFSLIGAFIISDVVTAFVVLSAIRLVGFIVFFACKEKTSVKEDQTESLIMNYRDILRNRSIIFYFIAWAMLSLVNYMTVPIQNALFASNDTYVFLIYILENIIMAITAVVCGFIADIFGRKRLTIIAFVMLGIGYAILGLSPNMAIAGYFYVISDGIAWGIFNIIFLLVIWGDLAQSKISDKLYFLGAFPYVFSSFLRMAFAFYVPDIQDVPIFSFASVFLFLAVLPLLYAPETLSEKRMKDRELKNYIEQAQRTARKGEERNKKKSKVNASDDNLSLEKKSENYEEAKRLAEKYY